MKIVAIATGICW